MKHDSMATRLINKYRTNDPFRICEELGILVRFSTLAEMRGYYLHTERTHIITIADDLSPLATRHVCAHELKHCLSHRHLNRFFMDMRTHMVTGKYENEAELFALCFNFPMDESYMQYVQISLEDLADCLNVPEHRAMSRVREIRGL